MAKPTMSPEEQLEDLQRRFQLLEGERKATYETAKLNIQQNKEIIGQMKDENKMLRNQIAQLRDEKPQSLEKVLDSTSNEVQQMQRRFDMIKNENNKRRGFLDQLDIKKRRVVDGFQDALQRNVSRNAADQGFGKSFGQGDDQIQRGSKHSEDL
mmetsp:Transcript_65087/g.142710  ORF Transcript_65087/g.142710 Transcript_65087/m.142710 type:complete len:154 (-) Transcript_65087:1259-1720(-)